MIGTSSQGEDEAAEELRRAVAMQIVRKKEIEMKEAYAFLEKRIAQVEVAWEGRIELVIFPIPPECHSLTESTKVHFLDTVNLGSRESRLKEFLDRSAAMMDEMHHLNQLQDDWLYWQVKSNFFAIKKLTFLAALLLNFSALLSHASSGSAGTFKSIENGGSKVIQLITGIAMLLGYSLILFYLVRTKTPMMLSALKRSWEKFKGVDTLQPSKPPSNLRPLRTLRNAAIVYAIACFIHSAALGPDSIRYLIIAAIFFGIYGARAMRAFWQTPRSRAALYYDTAYDVATQPEISFTILFWLLGVFGFLRAYLWSFLLVDFVSLSETTMNVLRAVTRPWKALVLMWCLFIIVVTMFASTGYFVFGNSMYVEGDDDDAPNCTTALECWWNVVYLGIINGDISAAMEGVTHFDGSVYYKRIAFDILFFIVLGILLTDIVTGIIIDTFSSLREETTERERTLKNTCLICDLERSQFDEINADFNRHQNEAHSIWRYLYFIRYLLHWKNPNDMNGCESYVYHHLKQKDTDWIPHNMAWEIQQNKSASAELEENMDNELAEGGINTDELLEKLEAKIKAVVSKEIESAMMELYGKLEDGQQQSISSFL
ncbi:unnamed protein product [Chrysoparadoxa australica]